MPHVLGSDGRVKDRTGIAPQGVVCQVNRSGNVSVASTGVVPFNSKLYDPFGWYDTSSYRFLPKIAGYYRVSFTVRMSPISGWTRCQLRKNGISGNGTLWDGTFQTTDPGESTLPGVTVYLNGSTDYLDVQHHASAGGSQTMVGSGGTEHSMFSVELVGVSAGVIPEPWHVIGAAGEPAFQNSWVANTSFGAPAPAFMKDPHGMVHLRGVASTGAADTIAFTLPVGYRPIGREDRACIGNNSPARLIIYANGTVQLPNSTWTNIGCPPFRAEG